MAMRPADGRNPAKTQANAQTSKEKVAQAKVAEADAFRRLIAKHGKAIDQNLAKAEAIERFIKTLIARNKAVAEALQDYLEILLAALQDMTNLDVKNVAKPLPKMSELKCIKIKPEPVIAKATTVTSPAVKAPVKTDNITAFNSMTVVMVAAIAWWKLVKSKGK
ncbi:hypothetical protein NX862_07325 [Rhodobacter sp. KR11]|uniref:hypothetical protein n=1 Tax=Rhodobacter sp. KR11 TaxID=2974588 RepID=UPI002222F57D|nr:hypothetical protein [Rhodobacter sp. KR11]MCW1918558.1 hypothetical protein [Rhodobacter sp. KR11]